MNYLIKILNASVYDVAIKTPLDEASELSKKYGVEMHVWKVCWNMGSYASKEFINRMIAEKRCLVNSSGKCFETWLCPSNPKNQSLEISSMIELASKKPHGIHFDYIRYKDDNGGFCEGCRERFEKFSLAISEISRCWHKLAGDEMLRYGLKGPHAI